MRRSSLLLFLVIGCVHPSPSEPAVAVEPEPTSGFVADRPDDRLVLGWAEAAARDGTDCPMSLADARRIRTSWRAANEDGALTFLVQEVACLCDVVVKDRRIRYDDTCAYQPQPIFYQRSDGSPATPDEERVVAWEHRLAGRIASGVKPEGLIRIEPIEVAVKQITAQLAETPDQDSEYWMALTSGMERIRSDTAGRYGCLLEQDLISVELSLKNHEQQDLLGAPSKPGRALVAEARALIKPLRGLIRACKTLETDPEYQRLEDQLEAAQHRLSVERRNSDTTGDSASCNSDTDDSRPCKAENAVTRIQKRMEAIERKHGVKDD